MKLLFPNGEHVPAELGDGLTIVGTAADCEIHLSAPGIAAHHCELRRRGEQTLVRPLSAQAVTVLNGKQITEDMAIKPGDLLLFAKVGCRVVASEASPSLASRAPAAMPGEDDGRTRVRMAMPKYMLRGVSGPTFGKIFGLTGSMVVGRNHDCDISIPIDEISRHHAKLQVVPDGVMVEDMGSANGTFVGNQRVHGTMLLKVGEELRLDTVRFLLLSPALEAKHAAASAAANVTIEAAAPPRPSGNGAIWWIVAAVAVVAAVVLFVIFGKH
jgi:pSer/pThr/pTyr-binding forkhead associated (FHA) protein